MTYQPTNADYDSLVAGSRARGIDPLDVTEVLWIESAGFNPASLGPKGDGAVSGLDQMSVANLATYGLSAAQWSTMTAAQQLATIFPFWDALAHTFNGSKFPPDGPNLVALNFLPALYKSSGAASNPSASISTRGDPYYSSNTFYDPAGTGAISVNTIAQRFAQQRAAGGARWQQLAAGVAGAVARAGGTPTPATPTPSSPAAPPAPAAPNSPVASSASTLQAGFTFALVIPILLHLLLSRRA